MGKTTVKAIALKYGDVAATAPATRLMGVLRGLSVGQDEPESTEIEAEFFDSPFDIFYEGNPVTLTFELANYELSELPALFGGKYDAETNTYEGAANAFTSNHSWELEFQRGHASLYIYDGLTIGTVKKDADGALNYSVTITALVYTDDQEKDHMYKIKGRVTYVEVENPTGNPKTQGYYEKSGNTYVLTEDTTVESGKTYYRKV